MKLNKKLSLKEEMEKEAKKIEEEIVHNPDLKGVEVSNEMESSLLVRIKSYEKKHTIESKETDTVSEIDPENTNLEFSEELSPNFNGRTNDSGNIVRLSEEDLEALRLGREALKKKRTEEGLFAVNREYHKHLNGEVEEKRNPKNGGERTRRFRMPKKKRFITALVAVCVLVCAMGVTSIGSKSYLKTLWEKIHGGQAMEVTNVEDMITQNSEDGDDVTAYREIRKKLGFVPVRLGYKPEDMEFIKYNIDISQGRAFLFYKYNGEIIRYIIYENDSDSSLGQKEEDKLVDEFTVKNAEQSVKIKEYNVKGYNYPRFIVDFTYRDIHYQLKGIMEKDEITNIIENLVYFNKKP